MTLFSLSPLNLNFTSHLEVIPVLPTVSLKRNSDVKQCPVIHRHILIMIHSLYLSQ